MEELFERPSSRSRKRRSLNLSLDFSVLPPVNPRPVTYKHSHTNSDYNNYSDTDYDLINTNANTKRRGLASPGTGTASKRSSFQAVLEQEKLIQQQLQDIARSENARLSPNSSVTDLSIPSGGYGDMSPLQRADTPKQQQQLQQAPILSPGASLSPRFSSTGSFSSSSVPGIQSSNATVKRVSSNKKKPILPPNEDVNVFMMSPQDLAKLQRAAAIIADNPAFADVMETEKLLAEDQDSDKQRPTTTSTNTRAVAGPVRPVNISGDLLSWQMAGNIINMSTSSVRQSSPIITNNSSAVPGNPGHSLLEQPVNRSHGISDTMKYFWAIFTNPDNFSGFPSRIQLLPPKEVVETVKSSIPTFTNMTRFLFKLFLLLLSVLIVTVQVLLLGIMLLVYFIGDLLIAPVRMIQKARMTPEEKTKKKINKMRKKTAKVM